MPKAIRGVYENGEFTIPLKELPEAKGGLQVIVIFLDADTNTQQAEESMMTKIDVAPEKALLKEKKVFSIADSNFFSLPPEHLSRTSADELNEIIAKEASGGK